MTANPGIFAAWFNEKYPGAYRQIIAEDIKDLTICGLIGRYRYYSLSRDGETIRGILEYEQLQQKRPAQTGPREEPESAKCKMCSKTLPINPDEKTGRPKEYCLECEPLRNRDRQKRLESRRKKRNSKLSSTKQVQSYNHFTLS